jgi:uncharacterized protein (TIGR00251 family)
MMEKHAEGTLLHVLVKPQSKKRSIRIEQDTQKCFINVKASPIRGRANLEVIKILAKKLNISSSKIKIIAGLSSTFKTILIRGLKPDMVQRALEREGDY